MADGLGSVPLQLGVHIAVAAVIGIAENRGVFGAAHSLAGVEIGADSCAEFGTEYYEVL